MRWVWRNIKKTRFLYFAWILRITISKRWGLLVLFLSAFFWFMMPIYLINFLGRYDNTHMQYVKTAQETQVGFWAILTTGGMIIAYLLFQLISWKNIVTDMAYGSTDSAQKALEDYENKLESLNRVRH